MSKSRINPKSQTPPATQRKQWNDSPAAFEAERSATAGIGAKAQALMAPDSATLTNFPVDLHPFDASTIAAGYRWLPFFNTIAGAYSGYSNVNKIPMWSRGDNYLKVLQLTGVNSPTRAWCLNTETKSTYGGGMRPKGGVENKRFDVWWNTKNARGRFPAQEIYNYILEGFQFGNRFLQRTKGSDGLVQLYHQPMYNTRLSKPDRYGIVRAVCISKNFMSITASKMIPPDMFEVPLFGFDALVDDVGNEFSIIHNADYQPGYEYYGLPKAADLMPAWNEAGIIQFYDDLLSNGFYPSGIVQLVDSTISTEEAKKAKQEMFEAKFSGKGRNGKVLMNILSSKDQFGQFMAMDNKIPKEFFDMYDQVSQAIISAHGLTGVHDAASKGGLSSTKDQIRDTWEMYTNLHIKNEQDAIAREISEAMYDYLGCELEFIPNKPMSDDMPLSVNEVRAAQGLDAFPDPTIGAQLWRDVK